MLAEIGNFVMTYVNNMMIINYFLILDSIFLMSEENIKNNYNYCFIKNLIIVKNISNYHTIIFYY